MNLEHVDFKFILIFGNWMKVTRQSDLEHKLCRTQLEIWFLINEASCIREIISVYLLAPASTIVLVVISAFL